MKSKNFLVLACLFSMPVMSQSLPDEINYTPYESRLRSIEQQVSSAEAQLSQTRSELAQTKKFIADMTTHISTLVEQIRVSEDKIQRLKAEIPELERSIISLQDARYRAETDLRSRQVQLSRLEAEHQDALRNLRPLEQQLERREQRLNELKVELAKFERVSKEIESNFNQTNVEAQKIDRLFEREREQQRVLENELKTSTAKISAFELEISQNETKVTNFNTDLDGEKKKFTALEKRVQDYAAELSTLQSNNAPAAEIEVVQRKLNAATTTRDNTANVIKKLEAEIAALVTKNDNLKKQLENFKQSVAVIPQKIERSKNQQRELSVKRDQVQLELDRLATDLKQARRNVETRSNAVESQKQEIRQVQIQVQRQQNFAENIAREANGVKNEIIDLNNHSRDLSYRIASASETVRNYQSEIPKTEQLVLGMREEISTGEGELQTAKNDEIQLTNQVSDEVNKLDQLVRTRSVAQSERDLRFNLYQKYLGEAEVLGNVQAQSGNQLGKIDGEKSAQALAIKNGVAVGKELGLVQAKFWGSIRGEILGYEAGYSDGINSAEDRTRAINEASRNAVSDAELHAQRNFKPQYFEEFVQEEFKKPLVAEKISFASFAMKEFNLNFATSSYLESDLGVTPVSTEELKHSESIKTPLDGSISDLARDVQQVKEKSKRFGKAETVFTTPATIPQGQMNCQQVYKGLSIFKSACEKSFKTAFNQNYIEALRNSFFDNYSINYERELTDADISQRELSYPSEYAGAFKIAKGEGVRVGKIDVYEQTYASTYKESYGSEIIKAKAKAKNDASREFIEFLKVSPLLTLTDSKLTAEYFRGNEEVIISGNVKNVGGGSLNSSVVIRVTEMLNASAIIGQATLNSAAPFSVTELPNLKVKVRSSAKGGDKLVIRGVIDLPADLYKQARQEKFELIQVLSTNPANEMKLAYDSTPDIKGLFRRNVHRMSVKIQPNVDDIQDGYKLTLKAVGDHSATVDQKQIEIKSGPIKAQFTKDLEFSYSFKDEAKGKTITLELAIDYLGKVIKKETITLLPH